MAVLDPKGYLRYGKRRILKKYTRPLQLEAPALNPEIVAFLAEYAHKRDNYRKDTQQLIGAALVALGAATTICTKEDESVLDKD